MEEITVEGFRLSPQQRRLWLLGKGELRAPQSVQAVVIVRHALDARKLEEAAAHVVSRNEILRTAFHSLPGMDFPLQVVTQGGAALSVAESNLNDMDESAQREGVEQLLTDDRGRAWDYEAGPLLRLRVVRLSSDEHVFGVTLPSLCADARTLSLLVAELSTAYSGEARGDVMQYVDISEWQNDLLEDDETESGRNYWSSQDWSECVRLRLPFEGGQHASGTREFDAGKQELKWIGVTPEELEAAAQAGGVSTAAWLQACWQALLWRLAEQPSEFALGVVSDGRDHVELSGVLGPLARLLPLRVKIREGQRFADLVEQTETAREEAAKWLKYFSWDGLGTTAAPPVEAGSPLCAAHFEYESLPARVDGFALAEVSDFPEPFKLKLRCVDISAANETGREGGCSQRAQDHGEASANGDRAPISSAPDGHDSHSLRVHIHWNHEVLSKEAAEVLAEELCAIVAASVRDPSQAVEQISLWGGAQSEERLARWNDTRDDSTRRKCIHLLFEEQAARTPESVAIIYEAERVTYGELNRRANQMAHYLRGLGVGPDVLVGLMLERSAELAVAMLSVLKAGGAYLPLDSSYPPERLAFMLNDSAAKVLVTQELPPEGSVPPGARVIHIEAERERLAAQSTENPTHRVGPDNLAYVIYTSGSTGRPKGVMISHGSICNRLLWMIGAFPLTADDRVLQKTPISFDASVWEFFVPLFVGAQLVMARPGGHQDSAYLRKTVAEQQVTTLQLVPSMLQSFLDGDDLKTCNCLRRVFCGGETLPLSLQERFFASLDASLQNLYGPTEVSIDASCWVCRRDSNQHFVPIGHALANTRIHIVGPGLEPAPVGVAGELYIGGDGLARGYLNQPALTAERFIPDPFSPKPGRRLYRSGDLARYLADGTIEYLGRADQQVKIRGYRIELGEVESVLCEHASVREAVALAREDVPGDRRLVAYVTSAVSSAAGAQAVPAELRAHLRERLPEYMVPAAFVVMDQWPRLPNGKLDRRALPPPEMVADASLYEAPRTPVEEVLCGIWAEVLGVERVGIEDDFFELGGHSLLATQVISRLREALRVEVPLRALFESPRVSRLAARVEDLLRGNSPALQLAPLRRAESGSEPAPLSFAQQRLWFLDQLEPGSPAYNIPGAVRLEGRLDQEALERTFNEIVRRHEVLRTVFVSDAGQPRQVVREHLPVALEVTDLSGLPQVEREVEARLRATQEAQRPFDLARGPVFRAALLRLGEEEHVLLLTMHHIASDGWSAGVLVKELMALYGTYAEGRESPLEDLPLQYSDYARWQREWLQGEALEGQLAYWRSQLAGAPQVLELPTDRPRPSVQTFRGAYHYHEMPTELAVSVRELSRKEDVTPFMLTLAAFQSLLLRYTGVEDIVVGTDIANRSHTGLEKLIGLFANQIVLRSDLSSGPTFRELLRRVRQVVLEAYAHQDLPFDKIVNALLPQRDKSRNPLFQVMFVMQNVPMSTPRLAGVTLSPIKIDNRTAKFDLALFVVEKEDGLTTVWNYNTDLFDEATIARMSHHYETLLASAVADPGTRLAKLQHLTEAEQLQQAAAKQDLKESRRKKFTKIAPKAVDLEELEVVRSYRLDSAGEMPLVFSPATAGGLDAAEWAADARASLDTALERHGALLLRGFGLGGAADFERVAAALCPDLFGDYGDLPRQAVAGRIYGATPYPADRPILFHHESSQLHRWPRRIMFYCDTPATQGGQTPLADGRAVWRRLSPGLRAAFAQRGLLYVRNFTVGLDVAWQDFYRTEETAEAERQMAESGAEWEWLEGGGLRTRRRGPAAVAHPGTGEAVFFNQMLAHHSSRLEAGVRESLLGLFGEEGLPRQVYYGDGGEIAEAEVEEVLSAYEAEAVDFGWERGDLLLVDNMMVAHGRRAYEGERRVLVTMGRMFEQADARPVADESVSLSA